MEEKVAAGFGNTKVLKKSQNMFKVSWQCGFLS